MGGLLDSLSEQTSEAETAADMPFMAGLTLAEFELLVPRGPVIQTTCLGFIVFGMHVNHNMVFDVYI